MRTYAGARNARSRRHASYSRVAAEPWNRTATLPQSHAVRQREDDGVERSTDRLRTEVIEPRRDRMCTGKQPHACAGEESHNPRTASGGGIGRGSRGGRERGECRCRGANAGEGRMQSSGGTPDNCSGRGRRRLSLSSRTKSRLSEL
eukprot:6176668-Pleurochrysis_carterae.AAC.3